MTRVAAVAMAAMLFGCGNRTVCEQADDIWVECTQQTTAGGGTGTGTWEVDGACPANSIQECMSRCLIDAYDDDGCNTVSGTNTAGVLGCQVDCSDAYRKGLPTGDTATP